MSDYTKIFERAKARYEPPDLPMEGLMKRRDRKRRNQRIAAGIVGMAVFVATIWVVTTGLPFDQSQTEGVPGGQGTGSGETGPAVTGPTDAGPTETGPAATEDGWDGTGLPPEGAVPSTPVEGEVIAEFRREWPPDAPGGRGFVYVYADGRVISYSADGDVLTEQRLTPEGVDVVRSGGPFGHPIYNGPMRFLLQADGTLSPAEVFEAAGAWADPEPRQYVPARYAICYAERDFHIVDPSAVVRFLPARAEALLHGKERTYEHATLDPATTASSPTSTCFEVTTEEARALAEILSDAGFEKSTSFAGPTGEGLRFLPADGAEDAVSVVFAPLLPHGEWAEWCHCG